MDFIQEKDQTQPVYKKKESMPLFYRDLFFTSEQDKYVNLDVPLASSTKQLIFDKIIRDPETKQDVEVKGNFKTYIWIGKLLTKPIVIEVRQYPAKARYVNTENYINKNNYGVNIPCVIYRYDNEGKLHKHELLKDTKYPVNLPDYFDYTRSYKDKEDVEYKDQETKRVYYFVFPVLMNIDDRPQIVFFSQPITDQLLKSFREKKILESPSIKGCAEYLFSSINSFNAKVGEPVIFFKHPNLEYRKDKQPWSGCTWNYMYNKLDKMYEETYFNFDFESIQSKVTDEYLAFLAARFNVENLRDKKGNGRVYTDEKKIDVAKSSINSIVETILNSLIYKELEKIEKSQVELNKEKKENNVEDAILI